MHIAESAWKAQIQWCIGLQKENEPLRRKKKSHTENKLEVISFSFMNESR